MNIQVSKTLIQELQEIFPEQEITQKDFCRLYCLNPTPKQCGEPCSWLEQFVSVRRIRLEDAQQVFKRYQKTQFVFHKEKAQEIRNLEKKLAKVQQEKRKLWNIYCFLKEEFVLREKIIARKNVDTQTSST